MSSAYEELIPKAILFNLKEIEELGIVKSCMMRKIINQGDIEIVKIGNKIHISRLELIRFLKDNTTKSQNKLI